MAAFADLNDYKIECAFQGDRECVFHTYYTTDRARGIRRAVLVEEWVAQKPELGVGAFGVVRLEKLMNDDGQAQRTHRAVKRLYKPQMTGMKVDYRKELIALAKFSAPKFKGYFVEFFGWFEDPEYVSIAMEYFAHGTLKNYINSELHEQDVKEISKQLIEALCVMHEEGFTHRDLKPQNIFVVQEAPNWWVKIGDFGITKRVSSRDTALHTRAGTPHYQAPEILCYVNETMTENETYTNAVDIWSFACVVYQMIALQVPFPQYPRQLVEYCSGGRFPEEPLSRRVGANGIVFVRSILVPSPSRRPTAQETIKAGWLHESFGSDSELVAKSVEHQASPLALDLTVIEKDVNSGIILEMQQRKSTIIGDMTSPATSLFSSFEPYTWISKETLETWELQPEGSERGTNKSQAVRRYSHDFNERPAGVRREAALMQNWPGKTPLNPRRLQKEVELMKGGRYKPADPVNLRGVGLLRAQVTVVGAKNLLLLSPTARQKTMSDTMAWARARVTFSNADGPVALGDTNICNDVMNPTWKEKFTFANAKKDSVISVTLVRTALRHFITNSREPEEETIGHLKFYLGVIMDVRRGEKAVVTRPLSMKAGSEIGFLHLEIQIDGQ